MITVLTILLFVAILVIVFVVGMVTGYRTTVTYYEDKIDDAVDRGCFTRDKKVYGLTQLNTKKR